MTAKAKKLEPIHPGEVLMEEFMKPMGISINRLAREIMVPPNRISGIVNSGRSITADTALRLGKYFGVTPETWLNLQTDYDLRLAQKAGWLQIESRIHAHSA
jgi:addiction module HigA family antidote